MAQKSRIALSLLLLLLGCSRDATPLTPVALGEFRRIEHITGKEAEQRINHLHGKAVTPKQNEVALYRAGENEAVLYVSEYGNVADARSVEETMRRRIAKGNPIFGHYHELERNGLNIASCSGMGRKHYFFTYENRLYWLEVEPPVSQHVLEAALMHVRKQG